jgi:hypothetical protein
MGIDKGDGAGIRSLSKLEVMSQTQIVVSEAPLLWGIPGNTVLL